MEKTASQNVIMEKDPDSTTSLALDSNERTTVDSGNVRLHDIDTERNDVVHYKTMKWWHCGLRKIPSGIDLG
jgi:hypothetical protein